MVPAQRVKRRGTETPVLTDAEAGQLPFTGKADNGFRVDAKKFSCLNGREERFKCRNQSGLFVPEHHGLL